MPLYDRGIFFYTKWLTAAFVKKHNSILTVAAVCMENRVCGWRKNLDRHLSWVKKAVQAGAELVLFPELSLSGFYYSKKVREGADTVPGEATEVLARLARATHSFICIGMAEAEGENIYNTQVLIGPQGVLGKYRKVHGSREERPFYRDGDTYPVFDIGKCKIGMNICYDVWFPEAQRILALKGAEVILFAFGYGGFIQGKKPASVLVKRPKRSRQAGLLFARAVENRVFVAGVNNTGIIAGPAKNQVVFNGNIYIVSPEGEILAGITRIRKEMMVVKNLDLNVLQRIRADQHFPLKNRRVKTYAPICL